MNLHGEEELCESINDKYLTKISILKEFATHTTVLKEIWNYSFVRIWNRWSIANSLKRLNFICTLLNDCVYEAHDSKYSVSFSTERIDVCLLCSIMICEKWFLMLSNLKTIIIIKFLNYVPFNLPKQYQTNDTVWYRIHFHPEILFHWNYICILKEMYSTNKTNVLFSH